MPFQNPTGNRGRDVQIQFLDRARLTDEHNWDVAPQNDISFRYIVEENAQPAADAARFKLIATINLEAAKTAFSKSCASGTLYRIPGMINCDRTFARDAEEAYYVDAMHKFLHEEPGELKVEDLPVLKGRLHSRYFCSFSRRPVYLNELYERKRTGFWTPGDSPDLDFFSDLEIAAIFPKGGAWTALIEQPTALPVPLPFSVFFYHKALREAERIQTLENLEIVKRLRFCMEKEYYILFMAVWWMDLIYGGKAFVLKSATIDILDAHCGRISDIAGKPAQAIIDRMRMFSDMPSRYHNWLCFSDRSMEKSTFIFAVKEMGFHDDSISSGRRLWCRKDQRGITAKRHSSTLYKRVALLDMRLSDPDLDEIPGLLGLVQTEGWARHNSLRVSDLISNLKSLYDKTRCTVGRAHRDLDCEERSHETTRNELYRVKDELRKLEDDYDHGRRYAANLEYKLDEARGQLKDAKRQTDIARRDTDDDHRELHRIQSSQPHVLRSTGMSIGTPRSPEYSPRAPYVERRTEGNPRKFPNAIMTSPQISRNCYAARLRRNSLPPTPKRHISFPAQENRNGSNVPVCPSRPSPGYLFHKIPPKTVERRPQQDSERRAPAAASDLEICPGVKPTS